VEKSTKQTETLHDRAAIALREVMTRMLGYVDGRVEHILFSQISQTLLPRIEAKLQRTSTADLTKEIRYLRGVLDTLLPPSTDTVKTKQRAKRMVKKRTRR
jgi:hypothetical protein